MMRLKSGVWVAAYIRRCHIEGAFAVVRRRGAEEAGAIFIKINRLDGSGTLYGPAPQTALRGDQPLDEPFDQPLDRVFTIALGRDAPAADADIEARLQREIRFDPDVWIIESEDKAGRHFLDRVVA